MEIADYSKERSRLITVVLTLVVIGLSLLVSTWQTMNHLRDAEEQHLFLSTRAVLLAVESSLRRGPVHGGDNRLSESALSFFQALEQDGDILFVGILESNQTSLITSSLKGLDLPAPMLKALADTGEWHGRLRVDNRMAYVYGKTLVERHHPGRGNGWRARDTENKNSPPVYLVVGVDMNKHLAAYTSLRKNVLFQAAYILAAAIFTWVLGLSLLARREQARKAAALERFQIKLLDNLPDGLITIDSDKRIRSANPAALAIIGYTPERLVGRSVSSLPEVLIQRIRQHEDPDGGVTANTWQQIYVNRKHLEVLIIPLTDDKDTAHMLILRDRTRLRRLEQSLADAEKLAAIGSLAAGVAHEVRNPLSSLRGFAQYFVKKLQGTQPEEEYAKTMVREADRLNRVITDLLFLAKPKSISQKFIPLKNLIAEIETLLRFDLENKKIIIETTLGAAHVYADADALKQSLLNLLLNSLDALDELSAKQREQNSPSLLSIVSGSTPEGTWIEVRDQGKGMTEDQRKQAFEVFFTAKSHGTGLGLALVKRTMLDHGGEARISSSPGNGCTVRLFFPSRRNMSIVPPPGDEDEDIDIAENDFASVETNSEINFPSGDTDEKSAGN